MAAQTITSHKRADSVVNGVEPAQDTLATAQSFCKAVAFLASDCGFQMINELVALAPQRELEIKNRDETIQNLRDELVALQTEHDHFNDQQLSNYERKYETWREENTVLRNEIDELEGAVEEKDTGAATLRDQLGYLEARLDDVEKENAHLTTKVKERGQQLGSLEAKLQRAHADLDDRAKESKETQNRMNTLQDSFDNEANQHRVLREEANKIRVRLKGFVQFSVKIVELDLADVTIRMERLWTAATVLVENFFGQDMPEHILENNWIGLRENEIFKHQIPLPQSNTDAAKRMRVATILGALTRLIAKFVFQPTYLLDEESGLRDVLRYEAAIDPVKERYTRGILLSMSPAEQEANGEGIVQDVAAQLLDVVNVKALLTPDTYAAFPEALNAFVRECQKEWKIVQCGKQKLEADFGYSASSSYPWQLFGHVESETSNGKLSGEVSVTTAIENNIVLIPRIYLVVSKAAPDPITHGSVLCRARFDAATEELRSNHPVAPFTQASSSRHRKRPGRTLSLSCNTRSLFV